jgi:hypothetical protein
VFASRSIAAHLIRGAAAATLLIWAWLQQSVNPLFAGVALVMALVAMRGCPTCWTLGLFETIANLRSHTHSPTRRT